MRNHIFCMILKSSRESITTDRSPLRVMIKGSWSLYTRSIALAMFVRKGAYARHKDFLSRKGCLDDWYKFEESSAGEFLCEWAVEEEFDVEIELRDPA